MEKSIVIPIEQIDNIYCRSGLSNIVEGGKTIVICSARGKVNFQWVRNADEFTKSVLLEIESHKTNPQGSIENSISTKMKELNDMLNAGLITQQEFEQKKQDLLSKM